VLQVAVEFAQSAPQELRSAFLAACSEHAGVHCSEVSAYERADFAALVVWDGPAHRVLRVELVQQDSGALRARDVVFAKQDPQATRFATAGYVTASLASGKDHSPGRDVKDSSLEATPAGREGPRWWHLRAAAQATPLSSRWVALGGGLGAWFHVGELPLPWLGMELSYQRASAASVELDLLRAALGGMWRVELSKRWSWNSSLLAFVEARSAAQASRSQLRAAPGAAATTELHGLQAPVAVYAQLSLWGAPGTRILSETELPLLVATFRGAFSVGLEF